MASIAIRDLIPWSQGLQIQIAVGSCSPIRIGDLILRSHGLQIQIALGIVLRGRLRSHSRMYAGSVVDEEVHQAAGVPTTAAAAFDLRVELVDERCHGKS